MLASEVLCVHLEMCPVHRHIKEVISPKINVSIKKKDNENNYFAFLIYERMPVLWNLFPSDVFISPLVLFSSSLIKMLIIDRICQVLIMDTVKITTLNPPKKCVSAYGVNIVGSHGGEMQASLTPVVY